MTNENYANIDDKPVRVRKRRLEWQRFFDELAPKTRTDQREKHYRLCGLIAAWIEREPLECEGEVWAPRLSQEAWADVLEVSVRTFRRLIKLPPIYTRTVGFRDGKSTLMRIGEPKKSVQYYARTMSKIWREYRKIPSTPPSDYGPICGLAEAWPMGWQPRIFEHTIKFWPDFKILADWHIEGAKALLTG